MKHQLLVRFNNLSMSSIAVLIEKLEEVDVNFGDKGFPTIPEFEIKTQPERRREYLVEDTQ